MPAMPERPDPAIRTLAQLKAATMACRECPIGEFATQSVIGEGRLRPKLMLVGEQPGDQEDQQGHPFVGPAGRMLARALEAAGIPSGQTFVSNAVKHFKFEPRGKRRIHKSPTQREIAACQHWLETRSRWCGPPRWWRWAPARRARCSGGPCLSPPTAASGCRGRTACRCW